MNQSQKQAKAGNSRSNPRIVTEYYSRMVDNFVDNAISATNLANNLAMVNMEIVQQLTDTSRAFWRVGVENIRTITVA